MASNKNIRSEYIKNLMEDKEELNKSLVETTKETLKGIVDEAVNKNLRSLISESDKDDDDFEEEEVNSTDLDITDNDDASGEESTDTDTEAGEDEPEAETVTDIEVSDTDGGSDEDMWDSLEQYKDEDGEYDLTGMSGDDVVKVLKVMKPEDGDGVRVIKKDDGNIQLIDDENDAEYLIVLDDECEGGECELGESVVNEGNVDLGYTDNYQDETAMTMDTDDGAKTRKWNAGTPTGNGKRWVGHKGDMSPYNENVNEAEEDECIVEVEMDECGDAPVEESAMTMANKRTDREPNMEDNGHERERRHRNRTGVNPTMNKTNESISRKLEALQNENKQLKQIAETMRDRLNEAVVINSSLGKIIKLVTENTTTRDEKINIVNRFNDVQSVKESNQLYESISKELKNAHPINNTVDNAVNGEMLAESKKQNVVETQLYESDDLSSTRDLMHRLDKIK
jgi:hypothetical protein